MGLCSRVSLLLLVLGSVAGTPLVSAQDAKPAFAVDKEKKAVLIPCVIAPRKLPNLEQVYPIEVIAAYAAPSGQKAHETVVTYTAKPSDIHKALVELGLQPGKPAKGEGAAATGPEVKLSLEIPGPGGTTRRLPIEKALVDKKTGKTLPPLKWHFTGSIDKQPDPNKPDKVYAADVTGTLIAVFPVTDETVFQSHLTMKEEPLIKMDTNKGLLPPEGTAVTLVIEIK